MGGRKRRAVNPQPVEYLQLFDPELRRFRGTILSRITLFHEERCKGDVSFLQRASLTRTDTGFAPLYLCGVLLFVEQKSKFFLLINHSKYSVEISKDSIVSTTLRIGKVSSPSPFRRHFSVDSTVQSLHERKTGQHVSKFLFNSESLSLQVSISIPVRRIFRHTFMKLREIRIRSIASCSSRDEFTLRLRNEIMEKREKWAERGPEIKNPLLFFIFHAA